MARTDRRTFLGASAAAAAAGAMTFTTRTSKAQQSEQQAGKKLGIGVIGMGGYGMVDARAALKVGGVEIVAICDVDSEHLDATAAELEKQQGLKPRTYKLHRELLEDAAVEAVIIASPPQWHALQLIDTLHAGKDIYCEKPLSYDIREGQAMVAAVEKSDRIVQVGFQRRNSAAMREAAQRIEAGDIGELVQVDAQIHYRAGVKDATPQDPPASLDWPLWCGPGPKIPYSPQVGHRNWRLEKTSGHGHLVDWGIHLVDATRYMLGLGMPVKVTAAGGLYHYNDSITTPDTLSVHFDFEEVPLHWRHRLWGATEYDPGTSNGIFFYGTKGTIFASDRKWVMVQPNGDKVDHEVAADMGTLHMADFLAAVRERRQPSCTMADAFQSTATVQLAMISYETGTTVSWDPQRREIIDNPQASALLKREYREPWEHPYSGA